MVNDGPRIFPMGNCEALVQDGAMDVPDACKFTGLGRSFLYALMEQGKIKFIKLGKRRLLPRAEVTRLLAEHVMMDRRSSASD